jgi:hypothetical protein
MKRSAAILFLLASLHTEAAERPRAAVFDFALTNTSPAPTTAEEQARLHRLDTQLRDALARRFSLLNPASLGAELSGVQSIRGCNGCEIDIARKLGADLLAYGWVQKVSNLILNINLVIEDVSTGRQVKAGSVDIRGNTDESWQRGLRYLLDERLFRDDPAP